MGRKLGSCKICDLTDWDLAKVERLINTMYLKLNYGKGKFPKFSGPQICFVLEVFLGLRCSPSTLRNHAHAHMQLPKLNKGERARRLNLVVGTPQSPIALNP